MKKIIIGLKFLIKKINFKEIKKVDILLLDNETKLESKKYKISRIYENIGFSYIFNSLIRFLKEKNSISTSFFIEYIHQANPKIAISTELSQRSFACKKYFKNIISITHQFATYWPIFKDILKKRYKGQKTDIFLLHSKDYKKYFNFLSKKFYVIGSLLNNEKPLISKIKKPKYDIMFISEFRRKNEDYLGTNKNLSQVSFQMACTSYIINLLKEYSEAKKKTVVVALAANRIEKSSISRNDEIEFYKRDFPKIKIVKKSSLTLASESNLSICLTSNLGPELLSRKHKVLFLNIHHFFFEWELFNKKNNLGLHWYKGSNKKVIFKKLDNLLKMNNVLWENKLKSFKNNIPYDYKNTKLLNIINKIMIKNKNI